MSRSGLTEKDRLHLTPAEFGQQLSLLAADVKSLVKVARKVGALKAGKKLTLADGQEIGAKELNALVTRHNKTLKTLKKNYTARSTRKKTGAATEDKVRKGDGFAKGSFLAPELLEFVRTANFGVDVRSLIDPDLLEIGLLSRSIMTVLLSIYEFGNPGLRTKIDGKIFFSAGPDMNRLMGKYLTRLETGDSLKPQAEKLLASGRTQDAINLLSPYFDVDEKNIVKTASTVDKKGNPKPRFDRNRFVYNRLQSIAQPGFYPDSVLDESRKAYVKDDGYKAKLEQTQRELSKVLKKLNPDE